MPLIPTTPSKVGRDPRTAKILLMGRPKVGKTTLAASYPGTLLIATEVGYETIPGILPVYVDSWRKYLLVVQEAQGRQDISRIVIDTFTKLAKMAEAQTCQELEVQSLADAAYGKGYSLMNNLLMDGMTKLFALQKQVVFVAHTREMVVKKRGVEIPVITVDLPKPAQRFVQAEVDALLYYTVEQDIATQAQKHMLYFQGREDLEIGGRYIPGVKIPDSVQIPSPETRVGWPIVEAVLTQGFMGNGAQETAPAGQTKDNGEVRRVRRVVRK